MTTSPGKLKVLKISAQDYMQSRNFPRNFPNKSQPPEKAAHFHQIESKQLCEISSPFRKKEIVKKSFQPLIIQSDIRLYQENMNFDEDHGKLLTIKRNLENQIEDIRIKSATKVRENDDLNNSIEKAKRSNLINSRAESMRLQDLERDLAEERQKNFVLNRDLMVCNTSFRNVEKEKKDLIDELSKFRNIMSGMKVYFIINSIFRFFYVMSNEFTLM